MLRDLVVRSEVGAGKDSAVGTVDGKQRGILECMDEVVARKASSLECESPPVVGAVAGFGPEHERELVPRVPHR
jgi:hypothetical protein